ncbi:MAG: hypothetical protein ACLRIL_10140 [Fusicatenibacter saccharivorans]
MRKPAQELYWNVTRIRNWISQTNLLMAYATLKLREKIKLLYLTVKYDNGYAVSENKYISPDEFNMTND